MFNPPYRLRLFGCFILLIISQPAFAQAGGPGTLERLVATAGGDYRAAAANPAAPAYFRFAAGGELLIPGVDERARAAAFFQTYAEDFGLSAGGELRMRAVSTDAAGNRHVVMDQYLDDVAVFGGEYRLHFNAAGRMTGGNGSLVDLRKFVMSAANLSADRLREIAQTTAAKERGGNWVPAAGEWMVYHAGLIRHASAAPTHVYAVTLREPARAEEAIALVDGKSGQVVDLFSLSCDALDRKLYNRNFGNLTWTEGNAFPGALNAARQDLLNFTGQTYHLMFRTFGVDGWDGAGGVMQVMYNSSAFDENNGGSSCPNARWSGGAAHFCLGTETDDIVAHEWGHAYTQTFSDLIYAFESGALNEAYSDIWGETVDLLNGQGDDAGANDPRNGCSDTGTRWRVGEGSAFGGAIRDMLFPECANDPESTQSGTYYCSATAGSGTDNGGVHSNSGVANRAFALLTDGNGDFSGIGLTKASHIFYAAHVGYLGRTSGFHDLADALEGAAAGLTGQNLPALTVVDVLAPASGEIITAADLVILAQVISATGLRADPGCNFPPMLDPATPPGCAAGQTYFSLLEADFENGAPGWTMPEFPTNPGTWENRPWVNSGGLPGGRAGQAMYADNPPNGNCTTDKQNGYVSLRSPVINLPAGGETGRLRFDHFANTEFEYDGGLVRYAVNGGGWQFVPTAAFSFNAYNSVLESAPGNDNPFAGRVAWSGADQGSTSSSWGTSVIELASLNLAAGNSVHFAFEMSSDGCNGWRGWYVDNVSVGYCAAVLPVTWRSITARADEQRRLIRIDWATEREENNAGFQLERLAGGENAWQMLADLPAVAADKPMGDTYT
ncbi:MAG: M4 family metallopeptidase, partial [Saprospiraceae bacterium]